MAEDTASSEAAQVTIHVKSSSDAKFTLTLPRSMTVLELKEKLGGSDYADIPADRQRLIYSGRVLKDPETLDSYKVQDGHTIHLVKSAASNQRQNPANAAASAPTSGGASGVPNVPSNIAAGPGNNPLVGLTGARFAGHAQLPGASMFGPDGGMGAPPNPEAMLSMLSDPQFASAMNEALANPDVVNMLIEQTPGLREMGPQARQMMQSEEFRRMMTDPTTLRQMTQMSRVLGLGPLAGGSGGAGAFPAPGITDTTPAAAQTGQGPATGSGSTGTPNQTNTTGAAANPLANSPLLQALGIGPTGGNAPPNPFAALFNRPPTRTPTTEGGQPTTETNPLLGGHPLLQSPDMMRQLLSAITGEQGGSSSPPPFPFGLPGMGEPGLTATSPPPVDTRPPEERYAEQLRQLNDMGFFEFERNVEALRRSGGSVNGAVEYLLTH